MQDTKCAERQFTHDQARMREIGTARFSDLQRKKSETVSDKFNLQLSRQGIGFITNASKAQGEIINDNVR